MDYNQVFTSIINENSGKRVLLHSCCAPCACGCIERFSGVNLECFFYNPNIFPLNEYEKRRKEMIKLCAITNTPLRIGAYDSDGYSDAIKGFDICATDKERRLCGRCAVCIELRLKAAALAAKDAGFDYFCTTLTVSPQKDSDLINLLGQKIAKETGVSYLPSDFKKQGGYLRSIELCKKYDIYRQHYCGCAPVCALAEEV